MKRVFTFLCALLLLLTSFSGMVVQAADTDSAAVAPELEAAAEPAQSEAAETADTEPAKAEAADGIAELELR